MYLYQCILLWFTLVSLICQLMNILMQLLQNGNTVFCYIVSSLLVGSHGEPCCNKRLHLVQRGLDCGGALVSTGYELR